MSPDRFAAHASVAETVPIPGVIEAYRRGVAAFWRAPSVLAVLGLVVFGLQAFTWHLFEGGGPGAALLGCAFAALVATPIAWNLDWLCLCAARGDTAEARDARAFRDRWGDLVVANVMTSLLVIGGLFLLVVPGVILYCRLRFVPYLVLDEGLDPQEAIRASLDLTRGSVRRILWITAVGIALFCIGLPVLVLGAALGDLASRLATAAFYDATVEGSEERAAVLADWIADPIRP
jgi:uncharacterized membrane protein